MAENGKKSGGIHIGSVGGDVNMKAGKNLVAGDYTETTNTTNTNGFANQENKDLFKQQLLQVDSTLRDIKSLLEESRELDQDLKDDLVMEIMGQIKELKKADALAEEIEPGKPPEEEKTKTLSQSLDNASTLLDKIRALGKKTVDMGEKIAPHLEKALGFLPMALRLLRLS